MRRSPSRPVPASTIALRNVSFVARLAAGVKVAAAVVGAPVAEAVAAVERAPHHVQPARCVLRIMRFLDAAVLDRVVALDVRGGAERVRSRVELAEADSVLRRLLEAVGQVDAVRTRAEPGLVVVALCPGEEERARAPVAGGVDVLHHDRRPRIVEHAVPDRMKVVHGVHRLGGARPRGHRRVVHVRRARAQGASWCDVGWLSSWPWKVAPATESATLFVLMKADWPFSSRSPTWTGAEKSTPLFVETNR